jgi:hypothetical protein
MGRQKNRRILEEMPFSDVMGPAGYRHDGRTGRGAANKDGAKRQSADHDAALPNCRHAKGSHIEFATRQAQACCIYGKKA